MKVRATILAIALAVVLAPVASARESSAQVQVRMHKLYLKMTFAQRFIAQDQLALKKNYVPAGAMYIAEPIDTFLTQQHLRVMQSILKRTRPLYNKVRKRYLLSIQPPHLAGFLCIHGFEGGWNANTGNGYYGGLQMDLGFQSAYGAELLRAKGTADHWTPFEQIWVAERAYRSRGFGPWPNTARACGLL